MDTGIPLFFSEIQYLLLETIPLDTIMRILYFEGFCLTSLPWNTLDKFWRLPCTERVE